MTQDAEDAETLWVIDPVKLKPGDVLLERSAGGWSQVIRLVTHGQYSHALLWLGDTDFIEAMPGGLRMMPYPRVVTRDPGTWLLLRHHDETKAHEAAAHARSHVFKNYDTLGAGLSLFKGLKYEDAAAAFCSQLVGVAYEEVGVSLVPGLSAAKITPADLEKSPILSQVQSPFVESSDPHQRIEAAAALDRTAAYADTELQKEVLISRRAYKSVRRILDTIPGASLPPQNLAQVIELLAREHSNEGDNCADQLLSNLRSQGYFKLWKGLLTSTALNLKSGLQELESTATEPARRDFLVKHMSAEARAWPAAKARAMHNFNQCSQAYSLTKRALFTELRAMYWMHAESFDYLDQLVRQSPHVAAALSEEGTR